MNFEDAVRLAKEVADRPPTPPLLVRVKTAEGKESHMSLVGMTIDKAREYAAKVCQLKGWSVIGEPEEHPTLK